METARLPSLPTLTAQFTIDLELVILAAALLALVIIGSVVVVRVKRWRTAPGESPSRIEHYRALFEQGMIGPEEFDRIRRQLEGQALRPVASSLPPPPSMQPSADAEVLKALDRPHDKA